MCAGVRYSHQSAYIGANCPAGIEEVTIHRFRCRRRPKCDELWLLIYVDGFRMSGWVQPPDNMSLRVSSTSFDRIFFLHGNSRVIEYRQALNDSQLSKRYRRFFRVSRRIAERRNDLTLSDV